MTTTTPHVLPPQDGFTPRIYRGLSFADYRRLPGWNWSLIKLLAAKSPLHVQWAAAHPDDGDTAARVKLRAIHSAVLEPDHFEADFAIWTGGGTRAAKIYKNFAAIAAAQGQSVLMAKEHAAIAATAVAVRAHPRVAELMADGEGEVTLTWTDEATGLPCKGRIDWLGRDCMFDLKTLGTTSASEISRMVARYHYHGQLAHYSAGLRAHGIDVPAYLVVAEGAPPDDVVVQQLDACPPDGALHVGEHLRARLMAQLAECIATDRWPGASDEIDDVVLPSWSLPQDDSGDLESDPIFGPSGWATKETT